MKEENNDFLYYYSIDGAAIGPCELSELLEKIDAETMVYREGITWTNACKIAELKKYFKENKSLVTTSDELKDKTESEQQPEIISEVIDDRKKINFTIIAYAALAILAISATYWFNFSKDKTTNGISNITSSPPKNIIIVTGTSLTDLSKNIKSITAEKFSNNPNYYPTNVSLDLENFKFSCEFELKNEASHLSKLGLYYGPESKGCESCFFVMEKNPGSITFLSKNQGGITSQIIGIYSKH